MLVDVLSNPTFFSFKKSGANIMIVLCVCVNKCVLSSVCFFLWGGDLGFLFGDFHGSTIQSISSFIDGRIYVFTQVKPRFLPEKLRVNGLCDSKFQKTRGMLL